VDHMCHSFDFVAVGTDKWLHDGWSHSCSAGHRHRRGAGPGYSGAKTLVAVWIHAGEAEAFEKGMARGSQTLLANP
jgi:hypothetical protein